MRVDFSTSGIRASVLRLTDLVMLQWYRIDKGGDSQRNNLAGKESSSILEKKNTRSIHGIMGQLIEEFGDLGFEVASEGRTNDGVLLGLVVSTIRYHREEVRR
ncbi:unnamed protein product [Arabis nemorensis]|uniref:Uncharacterized protein n=1 Tax=Arabis nemorensis TaxID=586526 RepID=A0A565BSM7_9BRAS|nr:unnamed protein product [Arabis nemorensis]